MLVSNICPMVSIVLCLNFWDMLLDISYKILVINLSWFKLSLEFLIVWLTNSLGSLDEVILYFCITFMIFPVSLFVENDLLLSLIEKSFSHILVFLHSCHFFDICLDGCNKILINFILLIFSIFSGMVSLELILLLEDFFDVLLSECP